MTAQDKLREKLDAIFPRNEVYVTVDDGRILIDGEMTLDQLHKVNEALQAYFEETQACPF